MIPIMLIVIAVLIYIYMTEKLRRGHGKEIKVYTNANEAVYKDADHVHLTWREDRIVSDTHTATLVNVKKL